MKYLYTGNLPIPSSHSITRYATEDVANLKDYLVKKGISGGVLKGCFTEWGNSYVSLNKKGY